MIPKIIHYCWLSDEVMPPLLVDCINSWSEIMPDYQIVKWDTNRFDLNSSLFVKEAFENSKWAFAADYIRLYALYNYGGFYLDSDVKVFKRFDSYLNNQFVSSVDVQKGAKKIDIGIQAAIMGAEKGSEFVKDCLSFYENRHFVQSDGSFYMDPIAPEIIAIHAEKLGFKRENRLQKLKGNVTIYPAVVFAGHPSYWNKDSVAMHFCNNSWIPKKGFHAFTTGLYQRFKILQLLRRLLYSIFS